MIKEIRYGGYAANTSEYDCVEGDLALSLGVIPEDGALKPIMPPTKIMELESSESVVFVHNVFGVDHYIVSEEMARGDKIKWRPLTDDNFVDLKTFVLPDVIHKIDAVGNTLIILAASGMHYFLWKGDADGYSYLGTEIPECPLSFGLTSSLEVSEDFDISFNQVRHFALYSDFDEANKTTITEQVLAQVNKFISEQSVEQGKFIFPFFVRYAYRLYDGTLTKHSAPILMIATTGVTPVVTAGSFMVDSNWVKEAKLKINGLIHTLDYAAIDIDQNISDWGDIVKSVDIFISKPIYTYDQNGECSCFMSSLPSTYFVGKYGEVDNSRSPTTSEFKYEQHYYSKLNFSSPFHRDPYDFTYYVNLPATSNVISQIKDCSQFYMLSSININKLSPTRAAVPVENGYLQSLVAREVMTDDYQSHDKLIASQSFVYNNRQNISGLKRELFDGFHTESLFNYTNGYTYASDDYDITMVTKVYYYIKENGKDIVVSGQSGDTGFAAPLLYLYYPNPNAYKAIITYNDGLEETVSLEPHNFLNGAFYFNGWSRSKDNGSTPDLSSDSDKEIAMPSKLYTSEINNPFVFPVTGINTIGTGDIIGISSAAKALSEGQFGQFPLYAFTTDGVWAMEVSSTGTYSTKQPISRDVCISAESITQIDSAVLFATNSGIMLISGSTVQCISNELHSEDLFTIADIPKCSKIIDIYNDKATSSEVITHSSDVVLSAFRDYLADCRMVYDYVYKRAYVYNPAHEYAYVYSLKSNRWGMIQSNIRAGVNSYPEALVMTKESELVDLSKLNHTNYITGLIITRPLVMDDPDVFKTINTIIQRGGLKSDHISQILYGSNDLINWAPIWSSKDKYLRGFRGTPYKAYRIVLICKLDNGESLSGCTIQFDARLTNRLR